MFIVTQGSAQNVDDVMTYAEKNDLNDLYHLSALTQRCAGLILAYENYLPKDMIKEKKQFSIMSGELFIASALMLRNKGMTNDDDIKKQISNALLFYQDHYYKKIEKTQLSTGSIFAGKIAEEFKYCKLLSDEIMKNK